MMDPDQWDAEEQALLNDARLLDEPPAHVRETLKRAVLSAPVAKPPSWSFPKVPIWTLGLAFGVGVGAAIVGQSKSHPPIAAPVVNSASASHSEVAAPVDSHPSPIVEVTPAPSVSVRVASTPLPAKSSDRADLEQERRVLEAAKVALSKGDGAAALASVRDHEKRFPRGALTEEREALFVQALASTNQISEARTRADAFRKKYPKSLFLPAIDATLGPNP